MDKRILAIAISAAMHSPPECNAEEIKLERVGLEVGSMKQNMSFYQSKTHRKKKGGRVNFK